MKPHQFSSREIVEEGPSLSPEFIDRVLGHPKCSVEQASYSAQSLEEERQNLDPRELLRRALRYVTDANQGRGDKLLEADIRNYLCAPQMTEESK